MKVTFHTTRHHLAAVGRNLTLTAMVSKGDIQAGRGAIVSVGFAVQSPDDEKENTELADKIAMGRAERNPIAFCTMRNYNVTPAFIQGLTELVKHEFEERFTSYVPLGKNARKTLQSGKTAMELAASVDPNTVSKGS